MTIPNALKGFRRIKLPRMGTNGAFSVGMQSPWSHTLGLPILAILIGGIGYISLVLWIQILYYRGTIYASGYSEGKFEQINPGMTGGQVHEILGAPLIANEFSEVFTWLHFKSGGRILVGINSISCHQGIDYELIKGFESLEEARLSTPSIFDAAGTIVSSRSYVDFVSEYFAGGSGGESYRETAHIAFWKYSRHIGGNGSYIQRAIVLDKDVDKVIYIVADYYWD